MFHAHFKRTLCQDKAKLQHTSFVCCSTSANWLVGGVCGTREDSGAACCADIVSNNTHVTGHTSPYGGSLTGSCDKLGLMLRTPIPPAQAPVFCMHCKVQFLEALKCCSANQWGGLPLALLGRKRSLCRVERLCVRLSAATLTNCQIGVFHAKCLRPCCWAGSLAHTRHKCRDAPGQVPMKPSVPLGKAPWAIISRMPQMGGQVCLRVIRANGL